RPLARARWGVDSDVVCGCRRAPQLIDSAELSASPVYRCMLDSVSDPRRALRQLLADWQSAGLTHIPAVKLPPAEVATAAVVPTSRPSDAVRPPAPVPSAESRPPVAAAEITVPVESPRAEIPDPRPVSTLGRERREAELQALAERVAGCQRCHELASARTQTVFGVGNPQAQVMFIGEAPGADEDAQGE